MNNNERDVYGRQMVECLSSFYESIDCAGGCIYTVEDMNKMTLLEFICQIAAPNGIRFVHVPRNTKSQPNE